VEACAPPLQWDLYAVFLGQVVMLLLLSQTQDDNDGDIFHQQAEDKKKFCHGHHWWAFSLNYAGGYAKSFWSICNNSTCVMLQILNQKTITSKATAATIPGGLFLLYNGIFGPFSL
jgi:hypothetical protein